MAHVMAEAVFKLFPGSKIAIGPSIDTGFYYDFELTRPITQDDLGEIEKEMRRIVSGNHDFVRKVVSKEEALSLFADQPYKIELINDKGNKVSRTFVIRKSKYSKHYHFKLLVDKESNMFDEDQSLLFQNKDALDEYLLNRYDASYSY